MLLLPWNLRGQAAELLFGALDASPCALAFAAIHDLRGAGQPAAGPLGDRRHHLQIAQQFGGCRYRLPLRFQKQPRLRQNPLPHRRRRSAPGRIQLARLAARETMRRQHRRHPLAVLRVGARHRRQILHRHVRRDSARPHLLLHRLRQQFHQRQPPRYPAHAAIEPPRQLFQSVAEAPLQLRQQPPFFQRRLPLAHAQRARQHQRFGLAQRPDHRFDCVPAQLLQRRDALVAVDDQVTVGRARDRHHHDGSLLARGRQRRQQPPLAVRMPGPQVLPTPIQLMKLQLHRVLLPPGSVWGRPDLVFRGCQGKCAGNPRRINAMRPELVFRRAQ